MHSLHSTYTSRHVDWTQLDDVIAACVAALPQLQGIVDAAPDATFRIRGQKLARSPHRSSGRTAMRANISVHEPRQPQDKDTMFAFSMEGNNSPLADRQQIPFARAPLELTAGMEQVPCRSGRQTAPRRSGRAPDRSGEGSLGYFDRVPAAFNPNDGWRVAPYYHLFGSDEMSQRSHVIQQRMPEAYVMVNPADAATLGVNAGSPVEFSCAGQTLRLPVRLSETLTQAVGLPLGLP